MRDSLKSQSNDHIFSVACEAEEEGHYDRAIGLFLKLARQGHPYAQINLANILDKLSPPDTKGAVHWYKRAAKNGYESGAWNLSVHYKQLGKERWRRYWLKRAAEMGHEDAVAELNAEGLFEAG